MCANKDDLHYQRKISHLIEICDSEGLPERYDSLMVI